MSKKILLVEDSKSVLGLLTEMLKSEGYEVDGVETGEEALVIYPKKVFDLIILDTLLPGISGFEVSTKIKQESKEKKPKIIIMTGSIDAVDAVKARESGADDYCAKTANFSVILSAVKRIFE